MGQERRSKSEPGINRPTDNLERKKEKSVNQNNWGKVINQGQDPSQVKRRRTEAKEGSGSGQAKIERQIRRVDTYTSKRVPCSFVEEVPERVQAFITARGT